jgi:thiamine biosynthesis lipoprotein
MATEFTLLFPSDGEHDIDYLSRAATECFCELDRIEAELSRYKPNSDIARINRLLPGEVIRVGMATIDCLGLALAVADETSGAFDVTVGSLMDAYRNRDGSERIPGSEELRRAGKVTGGNLFEVDRGRLAVKVLGEGVSLDLGGVGKGYALDQMGGVLENWSIFDALLNAGDSTVLALGAPSGETRQGWPVRAEGVSENEGILMLSNYSLEGRSVAVWWHAASFFKIRQSLSEALIVA